MALLEFQKLTFCSMDSGWVDVGDMLVWLVYEVSDPCYMCSLVSKYVFSRFLLSGYITRLTQCIISGPRGNKRSTLALGNWMNLDRCWNLQPSLCLSYENHLSLDLISNATESSRWKVGADDVFAFSMLPRFPALSTVSFVGCSHRNFTTQRKSLDQYARLAESAMEYACKTEGCNTFGLCISKDSEAKKADTYLRFQYGSTTDRVTALLLANNGN